MLVIKVWGGGGGGGSSQAKEKGKLVLGLWRPWLLASVFSITPASNACGSFAGKASLEPVLFPKQADVPSSPLSWGEWAQAAVTVGGQGLRDPERFCSVWLEEPTRMGQAEALVLDAVSPKPSPMR